MAGGQQGAGPEQFSWSSPSLIFHILQTRSNKHAHTLHSPRGEQQGRRATSTLTSFICTSKQPNSPVSSVPLPSPLEKLHFYPKGSQKTSFPRSMML